MQGVIESARKLRNRGKAIIFLGSPLSDGCDKTTVEPGNVYSPGVWTCGVSVWIETDDGLCTPDMLPDDGIEWTFGLRRAWFGRLRRAHHRQSSREA